MLPGGGTIILYVLHVHECAVCVVPGLRSTVAGCLLILSVAMEDRSDIYLRFDQGGKKQNAGACGCLVYFAVKLCALSCCVVLAVCVRSVNFAAKAWSLWAVPTDKNEKRKKTLAGKHS